jgi:hypothetical protein
MIQTTEHILYPRINLIVPFEMFFEPNALSLRLMITHLTQLMDRVLLN